MSIDQSPGVTALEAAEADEAGIEVAVGAGTPPEWRNTHARQDEGA